MYSFLPALLSALNPVVSLFLTKKESVRSTFSPATFLCFSLSNQSEKKKEKEYTADTKTREWRSQEVFPSLYRVEGSLSRVYFETKLVRFLSFFLVPVEAMKAEKKRKQKEKDLRESGRTGRNKLEERDTVCPPPRSRPSFPSFLRCPD